MRSCADETAPTLSSDPHLTTKTHGPARLRRLSIKGRCYERDNSHKTHRAKRSCLLQGHYKNDDNLEGIRKRKQEAIWQSTFSFPPGPHLAANTHGSFSFPYSLARRSISSFTFISWVSWNLRASTRPPIFHFKIVGHDLHPCMS